MNNKYSNKINNDKINFFNKDDDDDKIVFNVKKLFEEAIRKRYNKDLYYWAKIEGYKPETNGDIRIDDTLRLVRRF